MPNYSMQPDTHRGIQERREPGCHCGPCGRGAGHRVLGSVLVAAEEKSKFPDALPFRIRTDWQRRDLRRLEDLAQRARKAESAGFQLSHPSSPQPPSAHSFNSGSLRSYRASQLPQPPPSASRRSDRSPLPPAQVNAEYYDENGANIRVYGGNGTINLDPKHPDPFADGKSISTNGSTHSSNIIPIQYIPPSKSEEGLSQAARTLDEARQNLFKPKSAPQRPARAPDLDLRLNPMHDGQSLGVDGPPGRIRDSYQSENSGAPSFLSGNSYDVYTDAPRIVTSKQVHVGRLQQAEVVQFGRNASGGSDGTTGGNSGNAASFGMPVSQPYEPGLASPATFGSRSLTPTSPGGHGHELEEGLHEPPSANSTDLRFSMGSLAYRDSISTMGTGRYLARPDSSPMAPPRGHFDGPRESMFSTKSYADSFLSGFPMIPPGQGEVPPLPHSGIPQSSSVLTLDHASGASRPPPSFRQPKSVPQAVSQPGSRTVSVADSFLGTFPFVPPNMDDMAELPSAALPSAAVPDSGKTNTAKSPRGVSTMSEGLGGFEFSVPPREDVPAVPAPRKG